MANNLIGVLLAVLLLGCQKSQKAIGSQTSESQGKDTIQYYYDYEYLPEEGYPKDPTFHLYIAVTENKFEEFITFDKLDTTYTLVCRLAHMKCPIFLVPIDGVEITKVNGENNVFKFRFKKREAKYEVFADCGFEKLVKHSRYYDSTANKMIERFSYLNGMQKLWTETHRIAGPRHISKESEPARK